MMLYSIIGSLIESPEYHDGTGTIRQMLIFNDVNTIIDIITLNDEEVKALYTSTTKPKPKHHLKMSQINCIKFLKYYNMKQCRACGSFPLKNWLKVTRENFETFRISR